MPAVLTLAGGRDDRLADLVRGLEAQTLLPDEVVVADLGGRSRIPRTAAFPLRVVALDVAGGLPLAAARNAAVRAASSDELILLDVDCLPSRELVAGYTEALAQVPGIVMGGVRYGSPGARVRPGDDDALRAAGEPHPARPLPPPGVTRTDRYALLWSLSFALHRDTFEGTGGFDPGYTGYGAEDTDFAFAARAGGVPLAWTGGAECLHQHHPGCMPPIDRLESVVANAQRFRARWGTWPMEGWLAAFARLGLVSWDPGGDRLHVVRPATRAEIAGAQVA